MRLHRLIAQFIIVSLTLFMLAGCESDSGGSSSSSGLQISPSSKSLAMGASVQLTATYDGSDVTSSTTWSSSDANVASVSNSASNTAYPIGTVSGIVTGSVTITATYSGKTKTAAITVTSATLDTVQVTPLYPSLALAATPEVQFTATGIYSDGSKIDLSEFVTWSSNDTDVATISNTSGTGGLSTMVAAGTSTITATYEGSSSSVSGTTTLTLTSDTVDSVEVTPINPTISSDDSSTIQMAATILVDDGAGTYSKQDITESVVWVSGSANAPVSNSTGTMGLVTGVGLAAANMDANFEGTLASAGTDNSTTVDVLTTTTLGEVQIFPINPTLALGVDFQLTAKGVYDDGTDYYTQDLTKTVVWSSSDTTVATICNSSSCKGKINALAAGTTTITANMPGSISQTITLTIDNGDTYLSEIQVTPTNPERYIGTDQQFTATGIYTDGTTYFHEDVTAKAIWTSSTSSVAAVSNADGSEGKARNRATGSTTITATIGNVSGSSDLTVMESAMALSSIAVTPVYQFIAPGLEVQFTAIGTFTDGSSTVLKDVTNEVFWYTSDSTLARVSNASGNAGKVVGIGAGTATITADLGGTTDTSDITIVAYAFNDLVVTPEPDIITLSEGASQNLKAIASFDNGTIHYKMDLTNVATWTTADPTVATVDNHNGTSGLVKAIGSGTTIITVFWEEAGGNQRSTSKNITVQGYALDSIQITPSNQSLDLGQTLDYQALGIYSDGSSSYLVNKLPPGLAWISVDESDSSTIIAPIGTNGGNAGKATAVSAGTSTITAAYQSTTATETLTTANLTLESITVSPANQDICDGSTVQYTAYGSYSDGVNRDITNLVRWSSSNAATVIDNNSDRKGLVSTNGAVTSTITAALGSVSGTTTVTSYTDAGGGISIELTPSAPVLGIGTHYQLSATVLFDDGTTTYTQDISDQVYWTVTYLTGTSPNVAVSNDPETGGRLYGIADGTSTITAYWSDAGATNSANGTVDITVTSGTVSNMEISPDKPSSPVGYTKQLTATALYSDSNTQNISESAVWTSSDPSVATVSNATGSRGLVTFISYGRATITARFGSTSTTTTVTVW